MISNDKSYNIDVNFKELCLIKTLRKNFRHKEVRIMMRDGIPQFIIQAWISDPLDKLPEESIDNNE
jgi:hypothetical protein